MIIDAHNHPDWHGRDRFDNRHQSLLDGLGLPKEVLEKIYWENALKLVPF